MIYPEYIKENDTIGICAPSAGITDELKLKRLDNAIKNLKENNFNIVETNSVRKCVNGISNTSVVRAKELEELYLNKDVKSIICATGGDFLIEMLDYINYDIIKNNIKWLQGYSDPTGLLFTITTNFDIATIYGYNVCTYGMENYHESVTNSIKLLEGKINIQEKLKYYENIRRDYITGLEEFYNDEKVVWKSLDNKDILIKGRIIGGCLDVILNLIGTKFDNTLNFIEKYKDDGIVWYFDCCELTLDSIRRSMWQLKNMGWFKYTKGIVFGRCLTETSYYDFTIKDVLNTSLSDLNIPVLYDFDIGHKQPALTIINGSLVTIKYDKNNSFIKQELK